MSASLSLDSITMLSGIIRSDYIMEYSRDIGFLLGGHKSSMSSGIEDPKTVLKVVFLM